MTRAERDRRKKGSVMLLTTVALLFLIPLVGLAVDASLAFVVKARLSTACDAAALAAARNLNVGLTISEQAEAARLRALAFFDANFPVNFMASRNRTRSATVAETGFRTRTVTVSGSAEAPVYFMGMFGYSYMTVQASGQASRRDINLVLILDRSNSMNNYGSCALMKTAAQTFVNMFAEGRDRLSLVVFGGSSILAFPRAQNFKTASPSVNTLIGQINCFGNTSMAQALSEGYNEIVAIDEPGALNAIVLFTDGVPVSLTGSFPVKRQTDTRYTYNSPYSTTYSAPPSTCKDSAGRQYPNVSWNPADKIGNITTGSATGMTGATRGIIERVQPTMATTTEPLIADKNGCFIAANGEYHMRRDIAFIPNSDYYGNRTDCCYITGLSTFTSGPYAGSIRPDRPTTLRQAATNAVDSAAIRIRANDRLDPVIYTIGLGDPSDPTSIDELLLRRVANDPTSPIYDDTKQQGIYVYAANNTQLTMAFYRIASEVLRIAR